MGIFRLIFYFVIGFLVYRMIKQLFLKPPADSYVKGESRDRDNVQKKHKRNIEDADFEEIKDD